MTSQVPFPGRIDALCAGLECPLDVDIRVETIVEEER